jgi:hypothetical protein
MSLKKLPWTFSSDTPQLFENERFLFDHGSPCDREVVEPKIIDSGLSNGLAALPGVWGPGDKRSALETVLPNRDPSVYVIGRQTIAGPPNHCMIDGLPFDGGRASGKSNGWR